MLHVRGVIGVGKEFRARSVERCRKHLRHYLFRLDVVGNVSLHTVQLRRWDIVSREGSTKSLAPRFRNLAPAKKRDLLAMTVIYTVRP